MAARKRDNSSEDKKAFWKTRRVNVRKEVDHLKAEAKAYADDKEKTEHLIHEAFRKAKTDKDRLSDIWDNMTALFRMVRAWARGEYTRTRFKSIILALVLVIYFVNPFDVVPDFIPGFGYLDDAAVLAWTLKSLYSDLQDFIKWEKRLTEQPS